MSGRLQGKVVIVVGAGSIGAGVSNGSACARLFAREGATVLCADRSPAAAAATVREIEAEGGAASSFEADVRSGEQVRAMVRACLERYSRIDVLHHNVGIEELGELTEVTEESWDRVHEINLRGPMLSSREVMPHMIRQGGGSIINIASVAGRVGRPTLLHYAASKAAVISITRSAAMVLAKHRIRVNAIAPGMIDTEMLQGLQAAWDQSWDTPAPSASAVPLGRVAAPDDFVATAVFLASSDSAYMTGQTLNVCGGIVMS